MRIPRKKKGARPVNRALRPEVGPERKQPSNLEFANRGTTVPILRNLPGQLQLSIRRFSGVVRIRDYRGRLQKVPRTSKYVIRHPKGNIHVSAFKTTAGKKFPGLRLDPKQEVLLVDFSRDTHTSACVYNLEGELLGIAKDKKWKPVQPD